MLRLMVRCCLTCVCVGCTHVLLYDDDDEVEHNDDDEVEHNDDDGVVFYSSVDDAYKNNIMQMRSHSAHLCFSLHNNMESLLFLTAQQHESFFPVCFPVCFTCVRHEQHMMHVLLTGDLLLITFVLSGGPTFDQSWTRVQCVYMCVYKKMQQTATYWCLYTCQQMLVYIHVSMPCATMSEEPQCLKHSNTWNEDNHEKHLYYVPYHAPFLYTLLYTSII